MDTLPPSPDFSVAILAKAPQPGYAKTRLIPALGAPAATRLQRELTLNALTTAYSAKPTTLTLWCAPNSQHRFFRALQRRIDLVCRDQSEGDLGQRMAHTFAAHDNGHEHPLLLIGTDCPALTARHLVLAAARLHQGASAVFVPAEDGGYALIGLRRLVPSLFDDIDWSTPAVMQQTRDRLSAAQLDWQELETLWDVDRPEDVARWRALLDP